MPKEFDMMKGLVGTWEGTTMMDGKETPVSVVYKVTSNGSVLTEILGPGQPMEMISVYHKEGNSLAMTHYCALGNQPHMKLKKSDAKSVSFEMVGKSGIASMKEPHMHAVTLTLTDPNTLQAEWTHFENGKPSAEKALFTFKRKS